MPLVSLSQPHCYGSTIIIPSVCMPINSLKVVCMVGLTSIPRHGLGFIRTVKGLKKLERIQRKTTKIIFSARTDRGCPNIEAILPLMYWFEIQDIMFLLKEPLDYFNIIKCASVATTQTHCQSQTLSIYTAQVNTLTQSYCN